MRLFHFQILQLLQRELDRAWSSLKLEEERNKNLPPLKAADTPEEFAETNLAPGVIERDEKSITPMNEIKKMGKLGFMGMMVPEDWDGAGMDTFTYVLAMEEISRIDASAGVIMSVNNSLVCQIFLDWGSEKQKSKYLTPLVE